GRLWGRATLGRPIATIPVRQYQEIVLFFRGCHMAPKGFMKSNFPNWWAKVSDKWLPANSNHRGYLLKSAEMREY
ncbi:MAG: hypothetical protein ACK5AM_17940, partial [Pirellulaceae bacterium]